MMPARPAASPALEVTLAQPWDAVVVALRDEMQEYGGLLGLLEEQQRQIFAHDAEALLGIVVRLEQQSGILRERRTVREQAVRAYAATRGHPREHSLRRLLPEFAADIRPLLEALLEEINHLILRARRRTRQNQMLLARLLALHRRLFPALAPDIGPRTYSRRGQIASGSGGGPVYRVVV